MFSRCGVDLLAAWLTKSSPHIHFAFFIFICLSFPLPLCLSIALSLSLPADLTDCCQLVKQHLRLTAQPSHLRLHLNKQHDLPIKKAFTLIVLKQDLNTTCSSSHPMPKVLANANQAVLTCLKMKNYRRGGGIFLFLFFFALSSAVF